MSLFKSGEKALFICPSADMCHIHDILINYLGKTVTVVEAIESRNRRYASETWYRVQTENGLIFETIEKLLQKLPPEKDQMVEWKDCVWSPKEINLVETSR